MTKHTIETVIFRLNDGVSQQEFAKLAHSINDFVAKRDGFIARRLSSSDDGLWIEHVEWATHDAAMAAAAAIENEPGLEPVMKAIDGATLKMHHTALEVSVN
ncbi:hypothetical protein SAMN05877838_2387 [Hoeflea halophila]|uniref:Antibiotic biosynthesis monooxygenase n=1 Tax=Hoeflea halophila TaxID=714899 RepID=A0A286IBU0_9HYPH|nr:hypothetical protein [Hoeflea halophila]SOE17487.1 hypothetical protein SAMN05877838_2387 [Hoeflea halophila]